MLSTKELQTLVPAAFALEPATHCSPRYVMFPTVHAIELLGKEGFLPVEAKQDRSRGGEVDPNHARHMIRFRLPGVDRKTTQVGECSMDIILINASDGRSKFQMNMGVYRKICSNGMVAHVANEAFEQEHQRINAKVVLDRAQALSKLSAPLFTKIKAWGNLRLDMDRSAAFAARATALRFEDKAALYTAADIIVARREEDKADTLWNIFNRAQENGMRGGLHGRAASGRLLTTRAVTSIDGEMNYNAKLWELAEEFAAA